MINSSDFVKRLEKILEYYGITATAFAEKLDFNRSTISHLLSGRNKPSLEFVMKLLQQFPEVEMNWLLFGKGSFPTIPENRNAIAAPKQKPIAAEDLFSNKNNVEADKTVRSNQNSETIERIVIFYRDGSFNVYQN
ncbi:helix-turn-helix transcriptional regulator [Aequorivita todarodis]|uniref:helix-turn-helix domain-containing protein n=1 Tax=Aequorivita todarodis TaxID=2036821 RepID=UPI002350F7BD|nr:helix-turn-helix transcriptional regulator [Aequorivita todarodis]MDC7999807.1 helix-turn-helix transcriptional regulator [Aequorivita todarodis]